MLHELKAQDETEGVEQYKSYDIVLSANIETALRIGTIVFLRSKESEGTRVAVSLNSSYEGLFKKIFELGLVPVFSQEEKENWNLDYFVLDKAS